MQEKGYARWLRSIAVILIAIAAFIAGGVFLDRNLPEVVTEADTERVLPEGTYLLYHTEELEEILADPDIRTIMIPDGVHAMIPQVTLHKELVVESGALLETGYLDVEEDGHVVVEGTLDASNTMIRMHGENERISVASSGTFIKNENTIVWADDSANLSVAVGAGNQGAADGKHIVLDEEETFENALSVRSYEEWRKVQNSGKPVRMDADIVFDDEVSFACPVYVSEGVTLSTDGSGRMDIDTELFVNCGTMTGSISVGDGAFFLNYGTVDARGEYSSAHSEKETAVILNMGILEGTNRSQLWEKAYMYNIGTIRAYNFYLMGGTCFNYGSILAEAHTEETGEPAGSAENGETLETDAAFTITNAGRLYNYGYFTAEEDSNVKNDGWVENSGYFTVENGAVFENNVFYNRSQFECGVTSTLNEQSGIYYGNGEFRINGISSVAVWKTADWNFDTDFCEVTTEEEFAEALEDNEVAQIAVTAPIQLTADMEITKPVFLKEKLSAENTVVCLVKNTYMVLQQSGELDVKALQMDNSLLVADEGRVDLSGANLELANKSSFCGNFGEIELSDSRIVAGRKSTISLPFAQDITGSEVDIRLEDSWLMVNRDVSLKNSTISLLKESNLHVYAGNAVFDACEISLEVKSTFLAEFGNIRSANGTELTGSGQILGSGWTEDQ
jgi:hypothetical protein